MSGLIDRSGNNASDRAENPVHMTGSERSSSERDLVSRREESPGLTMAGVLAGEAARSADAEGEGIGSAGVRGT